MVRIHTAATYVEKGGVGKTTTTAHMAVAASQQHDLDVALLDLAGTQNDLSTQFGVRDEAEAVVEDGIPLSAVFADEWSRIVELADDPLARMTVATGEGPDLIPADPGLAGKDNDLANVERENRYDRLAAFVDDQLAGRYDLALFDLPGKEDNIALSGLVAAGNVVATLSPGAFERAQLDRLRTNLEMLTANLEPEIVLSMVVPTMIDRTTNLSAEFVEDLEAEYPDTIAPATVADSQDVANFQAEGRTLFAADEDELYATGKRAREALATNAAELLERI